MSSFSDSAWVCASPMLRTASVTTVAPSSALPLAFSADSAACEALRATSMTVAFISSMAVAVSPTRALWPSAPLLDCSTCAESSSDAEVTISTTLSSLAAACNMPSARARSAAARASSASRPALAARADSSLAMRVFSSASAILPFRLVTMVRRLSASLPISLRWERCRVLSRLPAATSDA